MAKMKPVPYDGEGSIYVVEAGKRYKLVLSMGREVVDPETGKKSRPRRAETFSGTLKQAIKRMEGMHKERNLLNELADMGLDMEVLESYGLTEKAIFSMRMSAREVSSEFDKRKADEAARIALEREHTFAGWCEHYLDTRERMKERRTNTLVKDRTHAKHLIAHLADVKISMITPAMVRDMYADMRGAGMGDDTLIACDGLLKRITADAYDNALISRNPMDRVKRPERTRDIKRGWLEPDEARQLVGILTGGEISAYEMAVYISLATGARLGEVLGMQWKHVHVGGEDQFVEIVQQYNRHGDLTPLKTAKYGGKSKARSVPIDTATADTMMRWKARQLSMLNELGIEQTSTMPVIANEAGNWVTHSNIERWFRTFCARNGFGKWYDDDGREIVEVDVDDPLALLYDDDAHLVLWHDSAGWPCSSDGIRYSRTNKNPHKNLKRNYDGLRFHWLRHTWATLLVAAGIDLPTLMEWGGWTDPRIPTTIYMHALKAKTATPAGHMNALVFGGEVSIA